MRNTKQREAILKVMEKMAEKRYHPTAQEVLDELRREGHNVWLGTVYRNLETFVNNGKIGKIDVPGHPTRFDGVPKPHPHIKCVKCGRVDDLPQDLEVRLDLSNVEIKGYKVLGSEVVIYGICEECLKKDKNEMIN